MNNISVEQYSPYLSAVKHRKDLMLYQFIFWIFVFILNIVPSVVRATTCSNEKTATINVSLDFSESSIPTTGGDWVQSNKLPGVQTDRTTMRKLNKSFFNSTKTFEFTDADAIRLENAGGVTQRAAFLNEIKTFSKNFRKENGLDSKVMINISTHGIRCKSRSGEIQWGFIIPEKRLDLRSSAPLKNDPEYLFNCDDQNFQRIFVSAKDLVEAAEPNGVIIDTCYAGHFEKNLISVNNPILNKNGFFILTSSNDFLTTAEEQTENKKNNVGPLFHALNQLVESPEICSLDLNGDGELSQDEVAFYMLGFYVQLAKDEMPIKSLLLDFYQVSERKQHYLDMTSNLGTAKSSQQCLMKIPNRFNCTKSENNNSGSGVNNKCTAINNQISEIHGKLINLFPLGSNHSLFRYKDENDVRAKSFSFSNNDSEPKVLDRKKSNQLQVIGSSQNSFSKNLEILPNSAHDKSIIFARDSRRKEALNFFDNYLSQLNKEFNEACPDKSGATSQCADKLSQLQQVKSDLEKVVMFYKVNKNN